jgi:3-isopropylmalate dehydrogenase
MASSSNAIRVAVLPGDGIGREVMEPCLACLDVLAASAGSFSFQYETLEAGAGVFRDTGVALPDDVVRRAGEADVMLLGAMGLPEVRYPDGREITPQIELREIFDLYAGVRPVETFPGSPVPLKDPRAANLDFVLVRENTEGLFHSRLTPQITGDEEARETLLITRHATERLADFGFRLAERRKARGRGEGRVTCVDKANVFAAFAFMRKIFYERASHFPDMKADHWYVDAMALSLIRNPWNWDVMITENMFGDILSDAAAALMGGMGMAPSADIGDKHALFQPCHGTAPDIMGTGKANPTAMLLSGAMMLDWLGETMGDDAFADAGERLRQAVRAAFADGTLVPCEVGGSAGLKQVTDRVLDALKG